MVREVNLVGSMLKVLRSLEGRSEGDPRKIADVIVQLANSEEVPMRLILGADAEKRVQQAEAARASEAEKWRHVTVSTVFEHGRFDNRLSMANSGIESWVAESLAHNEIASDRLGRVRHRSLVRLACHPLAGRNNAISVRLVRHMAL